MATFADMIAKDIIEGAPFRPLDDPQAGPEAGYAVQFEMAPVAAAAKGGIGGRKIAWNTPPLMEKFGLKEPGAAVIFADDICRGDANLKLKDFRTS